MFLDFFGVSIFGEAKENKKKPQITQFFSDYFVILQCQNEDSTSTNYQKSG